MAQKSLSRGFICSSCALRVSVNSPSRRTFSRSSTWSRVGLPTFAPTSSPELDTLLSAFRTKVFIPSLLRERHRQLIYRARYAEKLTSEPIVVAIGDEEVQLQPMKRTDQPRTDDLHTVVELMREGRDWSNLPGFLMGLRNARGDLGEGKMAKVARKAGERGMVGVLVECARQGERTGFLLRDGDVVREVMLGFHNKAHAAMFKGEEVGKALALAEQVALMMESPAHRSKEKGKGLDPRKRPEFIGVLLELSAARAIDAFEGKDQGGKVLNYAEKVLATWSEGDFEVEPELPSEANRKLEMFVPLLNGMRLALQVKELTSKDLQGRLRDRMKVLEEAIEKARGVVSPGPFGEKPRRGLILYYDLFVSNT